MPLSVENLYKIAAKDAVDGRPLAARLLRPSGLPLAPHLTVKSSKPDAKAKSDSSNPFGGPDYSAAKKNSFGGPDYSAAKKNPFGGPEYGNSDNNNYSGALYGLGGAGAGALLAATMSKKKNRMRNAALGGLLGGGAGLILNHLNNAPKTASHTEQLYSTLTASTEKQADMQAIIAKLMPYLQQAREAGGNFLKSDIGRHALGGGAIGAGLGGLAGLVNPGEDEEGNSRSRFGAMLRGALGGGALGAGAGGALGYAAPNFVPGLLDSPRGRDLREMLGLPTDRQKLTPRQDATMSGTINPIDSPVTSAKQPGYSTMRMRRLQKPGITLPSETNPNANRAVPLMPGADLGPTTGSSIAGGPAPFTSGTAPEFSTAGMNAPGSATYTPPNDAVVSARRVMDTANARATADQASRLQSVMKQPNQASQANDRALLDLQQKNPILFEQMMQAARDKQVESNLSTAPSMGFDASGLDTSNMQAPASATMGR